MSTGYFLRNGEKIIISDLKPCPFCGGQALIYTTGALDSRKYRVMCGERVDCSCLLNAFDTKEEAKNAWNRRITE